MDAQSPDAIATTGARGFLDWLKKYQPYFFDKIKAKIPSGALSGLGIATDGTTAQANTTTAPVSWIESIKNILQGAAQAYLTKEQIDAQRDILNIQLDRAKNGLSPLDIDPTKMGLPSPEVKFGMSGNVQSIVLWGGGLALAAYLLRGFIGRRHGR